MDDLISRKAFLRHVENQHRQWGNDYDAEQILGDLEDFPSARQWIPCSETVDIPDHEVLACDKLGEIIIGYLAYHDEQWICESETEFMYDPITWMPLPKPYREETES